MDTLEVLISCMHQTDLSICERTGIRTDALVINQCSREEAQIMPEWMERNTGLDDLSVIGRAAAAETGSKRNMQLRMLTVHEKGLSRSRNRAIDNAKGSIGLICDDDELLDPEYEQTILQAYRELPDADIIAFRIANQPSRLRQKRQRLNRWNAMRVASWQITFRIAAVQKRGVRFDTKLGAGTGNGAGEEVKFLRDCIAAGLKAYYTPENIGEVKQQESTWFHGWTRDFFYKRGITNRYMLGAPAALLYAVYYTIVKYPLYHKEITAREALMETVRGIIANDIRG